MTLQQLGYLVALDTHRQFGLAAEKSCVSQPALSVQVQKLEEELGVLLFDRTQRRIEPTAVGAQVIAQARRVLREAQQLREVVQAAKGEVVGELRLGVISTLAPYLVPRFLVGLTTAYPQLRVHIEELRSEEIMRRLKDYRLDVGLLVTPLDDPLLHELPLLDEPFLVLASENHMLAALDAIRPADLPSAGLWLMQEGHCFRNQVLNLCGRSTAPGAVAYESGSIETLKELVRHQDGYTLVPELAVLDEVDTNPLLKRFVAPAPVREVSLVVHHSFVRTALLTALRELILASVPERLRAGKAGEKVRWR
ncbi:hydrogen peroxide-inducible genes activator [Hymenobacter negativus]|uniref:LysR family transcriptional regulator n=1 Tax=Hymenobacter negativus TaxID=2795026 RepID=A0ABS0Q1W6_9BACT|nr:MULTISPECIES: hydrogen peroxide-inducible genes activator [Bacteria]MBH8556613.1 LysR family transcriptional regulator [Hymenobacter negativus]MBH8571135.1 LysR family transcriptional regulator [Hymenobacter negativus]MBR7210872.1 LysR family transcriptional regulator [Microvirga sp. STS02]